MQISRLYIALFLFFIGIAPAQTIDSSYVEIDSVSVDTIEVDIPDNGILNSNALLKL